MSFNAKQKKAIASKFVEILDLMYTNEEVDEEEVEEEEEEEAPRKKRAPKKKASRKKAPSLNEVRKAMRQFSKDFGKEEAKDLLEPYDAKSLSALEEDDYAALLEDIAAYEE